MLVYELLIFTKGLHRFVLLHPSIADRYILEFDTFLPLRENHWYLKAYGLDQYDDILCNSRLKNHSLLFKE